MTVAKQFHKLYPTDKRGATMLNKDAFQAYLISKRRNEDRIHESLQSFDRFHQFLIKSGLQNLSDFTQDTLFNYIKPHQPDNRRVAISKANHFVQDLADRKSVV